VNVVDVAVCGYLSLDCITLPTGAVHEGIPGGVIYTAMGARYGGAEVGLLARAGADFPEEALASLGEAGIHVDHVERAAVPARRARLVYDNGEGRRTLNYADPEWLVLTSKLAPPPIPSSWRPLVVVLSPMPVKSCRHYLEQAEALGARVVLDTSEYYASTERLGILSLLKRVDLFCPSVEESRLLVPGRDDDQALAELYGETKGSVVQKRGRAGLKFMGHAHPSGLRVGSRAADVVDTTGAGDSCVGGIAAGLARGLTEVEMLDLGCEAAALTVSTVGPLSSERNPLIFDRTP
jgi:ribokinase